MKSGLLQSLVFYIFGFLASWITYLLVGQPYIHGPGLHHIIGLATIILGFLWGLACLLLFQLRGRKVSYLWIFLCTTSVFVVTLFYIVTYPYLH